LDKQEADCKDTILRLMDKLEVKVYEHNNVAVIVKEQSRTALDTKAVSEFLGDKAKEFMKTTTFTKLEVKEL
jgi:hypothetical protein